MYYFIINPKSKTGNGYHIWLKVKAQLDQECIPYKYYFTHYEFHAVKLTEKICNKYKGKKHIIVVGGDGTINEVINGITSYNDIFLGYIPSGSSNDLARCLHIPSDPIEALHVITQSSKFEYFDHGQVEFPSDPAKKARKFAVSMGIGFDASICFEALQSKIKKVLNKLHLGKLTYAIIALKQLLSIKRFDTTLLVDGKTELFLPNTYFVTAMIHPCEGGGLRMTPNANPSDRKLSVCAFYNIPKYQALTLLPLLLFGWHRFVTHGVKIFDCSTLEISTVEKQILHTDGEFASRSNHVKVSCTPEQIRMLL